MDSQVTSAAVAALVGLAGVILKPFMEQAATRSRDGGERQSWDWGRYSAVVVGVMIGSYFAVHSAARQFNPGSEPSAAALQNIECNPCAIKVNDPFLLVVNLRSPVPEQGPRTVIRLSSSDRTVLNLNTSVAVEAGQTSASTYATANKAPNYLGPLKIYANDGHTTAEAEVTVISREDTTVVHPRTSVEPTSRNSRVGATIKSVPPPVEFTPKPAFDPGLLSRLDDAQGRLTAEDQYWQSVKQHMPAGTSLRPEITSLLFGAGTISHRCTDERQQFDASSLHSCIDELNDRLNQLRLQH